MTVQCATLKAKQVAESVARGAYGRLLAYLAYRWRNIAAAEDALAEALASALVAWPVSGVPDSPEAWLMTTAKRKLLQDARHQRLVDQLASDPAMAALSGTEDGEETAAPGATLIPDSRLKLMFVCAHPAIDASIRTALMLQTVLGLEAKRIAAAFLVSPTAMAQRLVRAKTKITQTGIRFEEPEAHDLPERTHAVLEAIYAAYGLAWEMREVGEVAETGPSNPADLAHEAMYLAELAVALMPASAEAKGLWALLLLCESRCHARFVDGEFVPLHLQDIQRWDMAHIRQADQLLQAASQQSTPGPYQLEAAIQAAHCHRAFTGEVPWPAIAALYESLVSFSPTLGALVGRAVAIGTAYTPAQGLACLDTLAPDAVRNYQAYWVARAYLLRQTNTPKAAIQCYTQAMGLTTDERVRHYLWTQRSALHSCGTGAIAPLVSAPMC